MAVPAYLRQQTKAKFITVATRLAAWTLKWCKYFAALIAAENKESEGEP